MSKKKNPWIAALFNFIFPGLGYLYVGKRVNFGALVLTSTIIFIIYYFSIGYLTSYCGIESIPIPIELDKACAVRLDYITSITVYPAILLLYFAFAYDAYALAEE